MRRRGKYEAAPSRRTRKKGNIHLQMMVTSAVSFLLCCSMLLGTTMAWFTDTVTSSANRLSIGELKVDVLYSGNSLRTSDVPIFGGSTDNTKWGPGTYQVRELTVVNQGSLDLNYALTFLCPAEDIDNPAFAYFDVYVKEGSLGTEKPSSEDIKSGWTFAGTLQHILQNESASVFSGRLDAGTDSSTQKVYSIALVMDSDVTDSSIQGANLTLNIQLHASQIDPEANASTPTTAPGAESSEPPASSEPEQSE